MVMERSTAAAEPDTPQRGVEPELSPEEAEAVAVAPQQRAMKPAEAARQERLEQLCCRTPLVMPKDN